MTIFADAPFAGACVETYECTYNGNAGEMDAPFAGACVETRSSVPGYGRRVDAPFAGVMC